MAAVIVALPWAMAFSIASGLPPERGLFSGIAAGFLIYPGAAGNINHIAIQTDSMTVSLPV